MRTKDEGTSAALEEQSRVAGDMLEQSLLRAVGTVEAELKRVVRNGEADIDRLARMIVEAFAKVALDKAFGSDAGDAAPQTPSGDASGSINQIAAAVARAARRGMRFS